MLIFGVNFYVINSGFNIAKIYLLFKARLRFAGSNLFN